MKILVTGAKGFIGQNLVARLEALPGGTLPGSDVAVAAVFAFDQDNDPEDLATMAGEADFVIHLAGVNRPQDPAEFMEGNYGLTVRLLDALRASGNSCPVMLSSSIQAALDNPYGQSKKAGEEVLLEYGRKTGAKVLVYRFNNVFGKWSRPNYNSVVATFCHNIARDLPIQVNDRGRVLTLEYIDDIVDELLRALAGGENRIGEYCAVPISHKASLGEIAELIRSFRASRDTLQVPDGCDAFQKKLYATYLSYIPLEGLGYSLVSHRDERGSFTEVLKSPERGQVSVNVIKPGITKGNHWHNTKNEKFLVLCGQGTIRFRHMASGETSAYVVSGDVPTVVEIPPGVTHQIQNLGETDMVVLMWANETFDPGNPDTYFCEV